MNPGLSIESIAEAYEAIDPVFKDSPQFLSEPLSRRLGTQVVLKVECVNPIRSFKGRGTDYLLSRIEVPPTGLVCASAGNFGQGMAYAARKREVALTVFAAANANAMKVERMRALGAEVVLEGRDFGAAKEAAARRARETGAMFVEDGRLAPIAEGAGTIAIELGRLEEPLDIILVPLGDGALITGVGTWLKRASPSTRICGVVAEGAPAMLLSWRAGKTTSTASADTIADGIAVREPIDEAFQDMRSTVDDVISVSDEQIVGAMRMLLEDTGLVAEPAGAAGLAAVPRLGSGSGRVGVIVTGGNLSDEQRRSYLTG